MTSPGAQHTEVLDFWFSGREECYGDLSELGKKKNVAVKHPGVRFMEKEVCSASPHSEGGWGGRSPQAVGGTFL